MVACDDDALLKAFLDNPALDGPALRRLSRVKDAGRVLRRLRNRYGGVFREAIHCPGLGGKGTGGYKVCVQTPPAP